MRSLFPNAPIPGSATLAASGAPATGANRALRPLRIGLIPERNLFEQRRAYQALATYLDKKLPATRVELVTTSTYAGILEDFRQPSDQGGVDCAFLGSLVAVLAADRHDAQVLLKSESVRLSGEALSTYRGVLFVKDDSPIQSITDLANKRVAGVRTTTGGAVFPLFINGQMPEDKNFEMLWSGTHEDVIREVAEGAADAGAVKDTRLEAYQRDHPDARFRRLAQTAAVPDNALLVRRDLPAETRDALVQTLLAMNATPEGQIVLAQMGIQRFLPCTLEEYASLYQMLRALGPRWSDLSLEGPAPKNFSSTFTQPNALNPEP